MAAIVQLNAFPNDGNPDSKSANEMDGITTDISKWRIIGSPCTVGIPLDKQSKGAKLAKAEIATYWGPATDCPGGHVIRKASGVLHPLILPKSRNLFVDEEMQWLKFNDCEVGDGLTPLLRPKKLLTAPLIEGDSDDEPTFTEFGGGAPGSDGGIRHPRTPETLRSATASEGTSTSTAATHAPASNSSVSSSNASNSQVGTPLDTATSGDSVDSADSKASTASRASDDYVPPGYTGPLPYLTSP